jgi:carotenoid cleavage dioxygenase-like enzyme
MVEPVHFPDVELYRGWGEPMRTESTLRGLELIQGAIPDGLEGALYKVGADRQYPSGRLDDIFIDGEGMIHMFRFKDNQVDYVSRWVHTERYKRQIVAKRALFGRYRNRYTNDPSVAGVHMGAGNTTAMFHAGHLYALKEDDLRWTGTRSTPSAAPTLVARCAPARSPRTRRWIR